MITQAQIEAVLSDFTDELTAQQRRYIIDQICRITAAQVGEPDRLKAVEAAYVHASDEIERLNDKVVATIEHCAQVAESPTFGKDGQAAAAAIRRLKDAP